MVFCKYKSGGVSVALQPHKPNLSCSMSGIPTDPTRNLTCLVEASNLSCSQVIWRQQLITTALHAQIKTWLWAICKNGWTALPAVCGATDPRPAVKRVPGAGCEAGPEVGQMPAGTHHGLQPFPHTHTAASCLPGPRVVKTQAISRAVRLLSPKTQQAASGSYFQCQTRALWWREEQTSQA